MENINFWGEWKFSPEGQSKINSICSELSGVDKERGPEDEAWRWLFSQVNHYQLLKKPPESFIAVEAIHPPVERNTDEEPMEISRQSVEEELVNAREEIETDKYRSVEDCVILLLSTLDNSDCNDKSTSVISELTDSDLVPVIQEVWIQLSVDSTRLNLCEQLIENDKTSILCQHILLPWLSEGKCTCIEGVSKILPRCGSIAYKTLILPLLASKDSLLVSDIFILKDLTAHLQADHWSMILCDFLRSIDSVLEKWHLPILVVGVENVHGARNNLLAEVLNNLTVLLSCHVKDFIKDRDFGNIIIGIINCLNGDSSSFLIKQLSELVQSYSGPLRYRAINLLKSLNV